MTARMESVNPELSLQETARKMRDLNIGSLPVLENGQLIGMITDRDICCRAVGDGRDIAMTKVREIMSGDVTYCYNDQDVADAAHLMEDKHVRRLAVLNRDKTMAGFLSVDDLAQYSHELACEVLEAVKPTH
ncbi:MAG: CBS domain-containing protein [Gammaproteobacteria bacterium]|nr:CBS domain-containing protein [Gammaproteobacteria bacterium]